MVLISNQYFIKLNNLTNLELAEYVAGKILVDKDERQFYTNSVSAKIQTQFLKLVSSVEESNLVIKRNFSFIINNFTQKLQTKYIINNPVEVVKYLSEESYLIGWLLQAHKKIKEVFTNEKLVFDPEITGCKRLLIIIQTSITVDEAFDKLKIIDNNWWLEASSEIGCDLDINIEFNEF